MEQRIARLEALVQDMQDREAVRDVLAKYGFTADLGHEEAYVNLWTDEGVYDLDGWTIDGRDALMKMISDPEGLHKTDIENRSMHVPTNIVVHIEGDTAWAECYSLVVVLDKEGRYQVFTAGYNHFDFVRMQGSWRITRRHRRVVGGEQWGGEIIVNAIPS